MVATPMRRNYSSPKVKQLSSLRFRLFFLEVFPQNLKEFIRGKFPQQICPLF